MTKKFLLAAPMALAAAAMLATPASAANISNPGQIRAEIQQLDRQIDRMPGLSNREEKRLEGKVDQLQRLYQSYARGGFSRNELQRLDRELSDVKAEVFKASRDFGRDRQDRNDHRGNRYDHRR